MGLSQVLYRYTSIAVANQGKVTPTSQRVNPACPPPTRPACLRLLSSFPPLGPSTPHTTTTSAHHRMAWVHKTTCCCPTRRRCLFAVDAALELSSALGGQAPHVVLMAPNAYQLHPTLSTLPIPPLSRHRPTPRLQRRRHTPQSWRGGHRRADT